MSNEYNRLYKNRYLSQGYPDLPKLLAKHCISAQSTESNISDILSCIEKLIDTEESRFVTVIGCGAKPWAIRDLHEKGYSCVGIEPIESSRRSAEEFLDGIAPVLSGFAESLPLETSSQHIVILESVLEHVDSPLHALSESFRILQPGGCLYVLTTNRLRFSLLGINGEFRVPYYNWFPSVLKECYIYKHLHFNPRQANYAVRPAVHWFTYSDLCKLGRQAGFAQFYHKLDLVDSEYPTVRKSILRRLFLKWCQNNMWLRAVALCQLRCAMFMFKRSDVKTLTKRPLGERLLCDSLFCTQLQHT